MKTLTFVISVACLGAASLAFAADSKPVEKPSAPAESNASNDYPLTTCVVSGEDLGSMGNAYEYVYKEEGKPDRVIKLCCSRCVNRFKKNAAFYLKTIDEAALKAKKS